MTSRQPGTTPSGPRWPVLVVPLTLLIILGLTGLRGAVTKPRWDGPLQRDGVIIGLALEVALGVLLVITMRRRAVSADAGNAAAVSAVAVKLRGVLIFVLSAGMVAVAVTIIIGLHLRLFSGKARLPVAPPAQLRSTPSPPAPTRQNPATFHFPLTAVLYGLIVVVLLAAVVLSIWWARRFGRSGESSWEDGFIAEDPEDLREAVESGRSALLTIDDARAAIIACYLAMEASLAERGAARAIADTPDELLARAQASGIVRGTAAARLTALFYEARFSSHPLDRGQRDAAAHALDELAAALAEADAAKAEP